MAEAARLERFQLPYIELESVSRKNVSESVDYDLFPKGRSLVSKYKISSWIKDAKTAQEFDEMIGNNTFAVMSLYTIANDVNNEFVRSLFIRQSAQITQSSTKYFDISLSLLGPYKGYKWILGSEEISTHWDTIAIEPFAETSDTSAAEGTSMTIDSGHTWKASVGGWIIWEAQDYLKVAADSGQNHCILTHASGYQLPPMANVIIQAEILHGNQTEDYAGLSFRFQDDGDVVTGTGYSFGFKTLNDSFAFIRHDGGTSTVLKIWPVDDLAHDTRYYTLKVVCQGNRFDCYADDEDGILQFVGTVFDDEYETGWYGIMFEMTSCYAQDFSLEIAKPINARLPIGAYDYNRIRMAAKSRLDDDEIYGSICRTLIAPDNPITFKQENLDGVFNQPGGNEIKVWDDNNEGSEALWNLVTDPDHKFVGDIIIDNGLIRLRYANATTEIKLSVYSNSAWEELTFTPVWSSLTFDKVDCGLIELKKYSVTLRESSYYETSAGFDSVWTDYTIKAGSPMVHISNRRAI